MTKQNNYLIDLNECSNLLHVSSMTIRRMVKTGKLQAKKINGKLMFNSDDVLALCDYDTGDLAIAPTSENSQIISLLRQQLALKDSQLSRKDDQLDTITNALQNSQALNLAIMTHKKPSLIGRAKQLLIGE